MYIIVPYISYWIHERGRIFSAASELSKKGPQTSWRLCISLQNIIKKASYRLPASVFPHMYIKIVMFDKRGRIFSTTGFLLFPDIHENHEHLQKALKTTCILCRWRFSPNVHTNYIFCILPSKIWRWRNIAVKQTEESNIRGPCERPLVSFEIAA